MPPTPGHEPDNQPDSQPDKKPDKKRENVGPRFDDEVPVEADERPAAPRRAASAEFVVDTDVGSEALLREAMDPANQSLGDALRLSFRVLQVVMLVLIVLFVFSGFQTVEDGQSGVLLRWGKILETDGSAALEPGLKFSKWPYPAGEFVLFDDRNRVVNVGNRFWPDTRGASLDAAIQSATVNQRLQPGRDGSVLTQGGDIAHIRAEARYDVDRPELFVDCVENVGADPAQLDADRLVRLALDRAIVHYAAKRTLREFVDLSLAGKTELAQLSQEVLDRVDSGIRIASVDTPVDPTPALAIKKAFGELQQAKVMASEMVEKARQDAHNMLLAMAGNEYPVLVKLIAEYEDAYELGETERSEALLRAIDERLQSKATTGEVSMILEFANSYRSTIERTLGQEARRFRGLLDAYREHPDLVVGRLWMEAYANVLSRSDAELIYAPAGGGTINISLAGQDHIRRQRRDNKLDRDEREAWFGGGMDLENPYIRRARDIRKGPGRQLTETGGGLGGQ